MKESVSTIKAKQVIDQDKVEEIRHSLEIIEQKLDMDILSKQGIIERQATEIQRLHEMVEEKNAVIESVNAQLVECGRSNEGNRQLINKLLGDLDRLAQDVEWYKRTYEKRSLLGVVKDRLKGR